MQKIYAFFFLLIAVTLLNAQITITDEMFTQVYTNATVLNISDKEDPTTSIELGSPSATAQTFDFSNIYSIMEFDTTELEYTTPGTNPGATRYPDAQHVLIQSFGQPGFSVKMYLYFVIEPSGIKIHGFANNTVIPGLMDTTTFLDYSPYFLSSPTPFTYGSTASGVDTGFTVGTADYEIHDRSWVGDGFGTLLLPGGLSFNAIRQTVTELTENHEDGDMELYTSKSIEFLTLEGYSVSVDVDTNYTGGATIPLGFRITVPGNATSVETDQTEIPSEFELSQNYPNPFNPSTKITYGLSKPGMVTIRIYNSLGELIDSPVNFEQSAGTHTLSWDGSKFSSGVYYYSITSGDFKATKKMLLMK